MGKKNKINTLPYQKSGKDSKFVRLYHSLINSDAYKDLKPYSIKLYVSMLDWAAGRPEVEYSYTMMERFLPKGTTQKAVADLKSHGFIEVERRGCFANRTTSLYKFSDKWKEWK